MSVAQGEQKDDTFKHPGAVSIEKQQEELLKSKFPNMKPKSGNTFLQKRLQQRNKYFDSGDYNMAKAQVKHKVPQGPQQQVTGDHMPTPDELPRIRKASQSTLVGNASN